MKNPQFLGLPSSHILITMRISASLAVSSPTFFSPPPEIHSFATHSSPKFLLCWDYNSVPLHPAFTWAFLLIHYTASTYLNEPGPWDPSLNLHSHPLPQIFTLLLASLKNMASLWKRRPLYHDSWLPVFYLLATSDSFPSSSPSWGQAVPPITPPNGPVLAFT